MASAETADVEADLGGVREAENEDEAEMDARIAAMMHLQQLQHKQEVMQLLEAHPVTTRNADTEFRMQLEELVRDHLNTCMALASCSDNNPPAFGPLRGDSSESCPHLLDHSVDQCHHRHHHHQQYLLVETEEAVDADEGRLGRQQQLSSENADDLGVSHGLLRPQSSIRGRWDERQGTEPTLRERQVREAELLALASLHTVSTLDASFLQPPPQPCDRNRVEENLPVERPRRPQSSLFQMWRELESERERGMRQRSDRGGTREAETEDVQMWEDYDLEHEEAELQMNPQADERVSAHTEAAVPENNLQLWQDNQDITRTEINQSILIEPSHIETTNQETSNNAQVQETSGNQNELREVDGERERVRQMVRRWMRESGVADSEAGSNARPSSRTEWLREDERERVREMAREWVRVSNFESRDGSPSSSPPRHTPVHQARVNSSPAGDSVPGQRSVDAERQEEMILELLMRSEQERQRELEGLSEHRRVSEFAHRNRLQNLLRGRFLRNGVTADEDRPPSSAAGEIGQLRQRRAVSGLREGFRFRLENIVRGQGNPPPTEPQPRRLPNQQFLSTATVTSRLTPMGAQAVPRDMPAVRAARRASELQSLEDATAYNMELRELLGRRSVTTMLASEFRDRLDQLIRSFIHRQGRTPQPWSIAGPARDTTAHQERGQQQLPEVDREVGNNPAQAVPMFVPIPPPPPLPLWLRIPQAAVTTTAAWPRPSIRAGEVEFDSTSRDLRADVAVLQRGMGELRGMMETCIQMQLELQRSIRQELSGALQRMYIGKEIPGEALDGARWTSVKNGTCCICVDKAIDSLLYRCGHMCTCLSCAMELHENSGRCPMCRATIVEVVRAFTVT